MRKRKTGRGVSAAAWFYSQPGFHSNPTLGAIERAAREQAAVADQLAAERGHIDNPPTYEPRRDPVSGDETE